MWKRAASARNASAKSSRARWPRPSWCACSAGSRTRQFKKVVTGYKKFYAHDEKGEAKPGDKVRIVETRPMSKLKRWQLVEVVERGVEETVAA